MSTKGHVKRGRGGEDIPSPASLRANKHQKQEQNDKMEDEERKQETPPRRGLRKRKKPGQAENEENAKRARVIPTSVLLAKSYKPEKHNPKGWLISEKLDGVRAWWTGSTFISRDKNRYMAPKFFREGLPNFPLDGELWIGRGKFQECVGVVRRHEGGKLWESVKYMVFDAPMYNAEFEERLEIASEAISDHKYSQMVEHSKCKGKGHVEEELKKIEDQGGEGIMLREPKSMYVQGRSNTLLKVKTFHDDEAIVLKIEKGKGRNFGRMGAIFVKNRAGVQFKIGSGFSDAERNKPPKKGTIVTYKYQELTKAGKPRFPVFLRVRTDVDKF